MNTPEAPDDDPLLNAIGEHIKSKEKRLDTRSLAERLLNTSCRRPRRFPDSTRKWSRPGLTLGLGATGLAAAVLSAILLSPSSEIRAESTVREAAARLQLPLERCYMVEVRAMGESEVEALAPARTMKIWAADGKFRVEMSRGNFRCAWGRDPDGTVWLTAHPQRGLRIAPDEQGPGLLWISELYGMRPETIISQILARCRLREGTRAGINDPRVIHAEPRALARQAWLRSATLELDPETKAIRKLSLTRSGNIDGSTTAATFTLIDTRPVDHSRYGLEGNLVEPYQIYDGDFQPGRRREIISRWTGARVDAWLKSPTKNGTSGVSP